MKDLLNYRNLVTIRSALQILFPDYTFEVYARYDPINFVFFFLIKFYDGENINDCFPISVIPDDLYDSEEDIVKRIINVTCDALKEKGY